ALWIEKAYGGNLIITDGSASFYYAGSNMAGSNTARSNTVSLGFGPGFQLSPLRAQRKFIHEQTHRYRAQAKLTPDPLKYQLQHYVELMLEEEAAAEGNGADHMLELHPDGPFTLSEQIYVDAYRPAYQQTYEDLHKLEPEALERTLRAEGRKSGQAALLRAFKDKILVPSTVPQDLKKNKDTLKGYEEYYTEQWHLAQAQQKTAVLNPVPLIKHDLTGKLLQNLGNPFPQDLMKTWAGRGALKTEYLSGGQLFVTNGTGSFYDPDSNTISIGLGGTFKLDERFA